MAIVARSRRSRPAAIAAGVLVLIVVAGLAVAGLVRGPDRPSYGTDTVRINGTREPDGKPIILTGTLYLPHVAGRAPAVLLAHGWGSDSASVAPEAKALVARGFVVLAYDARGHGGSGGKIHLDSPDYEVKDAGLMLDYLANRPEVRLDAPGDPRVGVVGASYGGALALMLAGTDRRVDAVVPSITWHDLRQALFPQFAVTGADPGPASATPIGTPGVFKKQWAAVLLGSAAAQGTAQAVPSAEPSPSATQGRLGLETLSAACGKIANDLCLGYIQAATTGRPTADLLKLLARSSPAAVAGRITAPTLLIQGQADSLFPLSEADANARAIAANGTSVQVVWEGGGHDGGIDESARLTALTGDFLTKTLGGAGRVAHPSPSRPSPWQVTVPDATVSTSDTQPAPELRDATAYHGLTGTGTTRDTKLPLSGGQQLIVSPPGATPAALTSLPGLGSLTGLLSSAGSATGGGDAGISGLSGLDTARLPGQVASFTTAPLARAVTITGAGRVTVTVTSTAKDATLFASLVDVAPNGRTTLPEQLVDPVRLEDLPAAGRTVTIALPGIVRDVPAGHRLRVVLSATDQAYALPVDARGYRVSLAAPQLTLPTVPLTAQQSGNSLSGLIRPALGVLLLAVVLLVVFTVRARTARRRGVPADPALETVPLAIEGLGKAYADGFRAVTDLTFRVEAGQVLGLLGPNGAGKTTTLRMLMGLIHPSEGEIRVFGQLVLPGAPVLSRLGSFVEGPGFLPHLSGLENLRLYWGATGRPVGDAGFDVALEIAGLGDDVQRRVRTYSQGMRQRLAIAQAMLGLPDLLVLDEPTNGLDPPQIREMREVLAGYAATGRTVVVSSHLLAEVEQTCTDVVVMHHGRLVAQGPVGELAGASTRTVVDVDDAPRAARLARGVPGVTQVEERDGGIVLQADGPARASVVTALAAAGLRVGRVAPQRGLEETFLTLVGEAP